MRRSARKNCWTAAHLPPIWRSRKRPGMSVCVLLPKFGNFITIFRMKQNRWGICPAWAISAAPITRKNGSCWRAIWQNRRFGKGFCRNTKYSWTPTAKTVRCCASITTGRRRFSPDWKNCPYRVKNITPTWRLFRKQADLSPKMKSRLLLQMGAALRVERHAFIRSSRRRTHPRRVPIF